MAKTEAQFDKAIQVCRDVYSKKLKDYGAAWRIMRPCSITDQIFIKANRIRTLETKGDHYVDEGIQPELIGIVNYAIMGMIQLSKGFADGDDISVDEALRLYDEYMQKTRTLMLAKNHDYDEAWRSMRTTSYTDLILMKIYRTKQIESNNGKTIISEGIEANYMDMVNYAIFGLIKIDEAENK
ncbi:MAG: DUF1599 domain-containing protein [Paludibacteraceae bacterium]|jgi:hypothetical protein|nr:DUF1599 domain-containing protein [Paludibacteraceae bacterium]MDD5997333.1 DUF1599 domain-containing protein [Bacteroidales bacterium]MBQ6561680.1 DUF1599 domain-containing protein [Paludibacteraceae bacterium]MBQ8020172.1 DUF1599 domain-containing protein [Paludibacteraceae bacterium]MBR6112776.1 DUF1599 domain-containing protein [Paludibacteraceae bacterium]